MIHTCKFSLTHFWNVISPPCLFPNVFAFTAKDRVWVGHSGSWWPLCILPPFFTCVFNLTKCSDTKALTLGAFLRYRFCSDLHWEWYCWNAPLVSCGYFHGGRAREGTDSISWAFYTGPLTAQSVVVTELFGFSRQSSCWLQHVSLRWTLVTRSK